MERIELRVERRGGYPVEHAQTVVFGIAGGTIGRGGQNKLVLPDSDAGVARVHAMVRLESDGAHIANLCERRSMFVDECEVHSGEEVPLPAGAQIGIGPYTLRVLGPHTTQAPSPASAAALPAAVSLPRAAILETPNPWSDIPQQSGGESFGRPGSSADPFASLLPAATSGAPAGDDNPFAMLGRAPVAASVTPADAPDHGTVEPQPAVTVPSRGRPARPITPAAARPLIIPADFDPFARDQQKDAQADDPWAGGLPATSLGEVAKLRHDDLLRDAPDFMPASQRMDDPAHTGLPKALDPRSELDPLALFGANDLPDASAGSFLALANGSELNQVFSMPRGADASAQRDRQDSAPADESAAGLQVTKGLWLLDGTEEPASVNDWLEPAIVQSQPGAGLELPVATPPEAAPQVQELAPAAVRVRTEPQPANPADLHVLVSAFLEGAGVAPQRSEPTLTPEFMRSFGEAFRVAVQGTIDLLAARSEIKKELRAGVTIIASGANNPLKFLPTAEGVLLQMTGQHFPGFMQPVPAMQEAYRDLQVHQIALMAGIRAAYSEALARFDPAEVEKRSATAGGLMARVSATSRKAALWDDYSQNYKALRRNAEDDLMAFSGKTFVEAYEAAADAARETR